MLKAKFGTNSLESDTNDENVQFKTLCKCLS